MTRGGVGANHLADLRLQCRIQFHPLTQAHEQHHPHIALPLLADGERFQHRLNLFHLPIDFRGADAHPAGVEHRIRAAVDDQPAVRGLFGVIPVRPDAGEALEVGGAETAAVLILPEAQRHGREGLAADQFALTLSQPLALVIPHLNRHAQTLALQLATPDRRGRIAQGKAGNDVGAAGDRRQAQIRLEAAVDVIEAFVRQR